MTFVLLVALLLAGCARNSPPLIDEITTSAAILAPGASCTLTCIAEDPEGGRLRYFWSADVGGLSAADSNPVTFTAPPSDGTATVKVQVTDSRSAASEETIELTVRAPVPGNTAPTAAIVAIPSSGDTATEFLFDVSASTDAEDPVTSLAVRWDWDDDGTWDTSAESSVIATHVFDAAGSWTVTCEVADTGGLTSQASTSVDVASARLRFVAMGDSRGTAAVAPVNTEVLASIVTDILALEPLPSFVLFCGDLVYGGGTAQIAQWLETMAPLEAEGIAIYPVPGNHDLGSTASIQHDNQTQYQEAFALPTDGPDGYEELCYSFCAGPAVFVGLDSDYHDGTSLLAHVITQPQRDWLPSALSPDWSQPIRHRFVFTHDPAYPVGPHVGSSLDAHLEERNAFWQILVDAKVRAFFAGHEHLYARWIIDGDVDSRWTTAVTELIVGTCGAPMATGATQSCDVWATAYHFCVVDVDGPLVVYTVYGQDMSVIDIFSVTE